jgi:YHS domain-containing protein
MRFIIWLILGYLGYRIIKGLLAERGIPSHGKATGTETFQDPVCGVYVAADDAVVGRMAEERIYFCSMNCLEKYREQQQTKKY